MAGEVKTLVFASGVSVATPSTIATNQATSAKVADYTVLDDDGIGTVLMTTGATTRTVTLPTAADNSNRIITIKKVDGGAGLVTIDGEGAETVDGAATYTLNSQYESVTLQCDGSAWHLTVLGEVSQSQLGLVQSAGQLKGTNTNDNAAAGYVGEYVEDDFTGTVTAGITGAYTEVANLTLSPGDWNVTANISYVRNGATVAVGSAVALCISTVPNNITGTTLYGDRIVEDIQDTAVDYLHFTLEKRISISVGDVYYLNAYAIYSAGSPYWAGIFSARRVR